MEKISILKSFVSKSLFTLEYAKKIVWNLLEMKTLVLLGKNKNLLSEIDAKAE